MEQSETYMTIHNLAQEILAFADKIENESINREEIAEMADLSRELYERLVVVRYNSLAAMADKPLEENKADGAIKKEKTAAENYESSSSSEEETPPMASETFEEVVDFKDKKFRLDLGDPKAISPNQISLIDSIEEIKKMDSSLNDKFSEPVENPSIGKKLQKTPLTNLKSALSINQRFVYISELFNGDADDFENSLGKLNNFTSFIEADEFIQNKLKKKYDWETKDPNVISFLNLIERRYI